MLCHGGELSSYVTDTDVGVTGRLESSGWAAFKVISEPIIVNEKL